MIFPTTDHDLSVFGGLTLMSTILGGIIGEPAAAAFVALVVGVGGQLLARFLAPTVDEHGQRFARWTGKHKAQPRPPAEPPDDPDASG